MSVSGHQGMRELDGHVYVGDVAETQMHRGARRRNCGSGAASTSPMRGPRLSALPSWRNRPRSSPPRPSQFRTLCGKTSQRLADRRAIPALMAWVRNRSCAAQQRFRGPRREFLPGYRKKDLRRNEFVAGEFAIPPRNDEQRLASYKISSG